MKYEDSETARAVKPEAALPSSFIISLPKSCSALLGYALDVELAELLEIHLARGR